MITDHEQLWTDQADQLHIQTALRIYLQECIEECRSPDPGIMRGLNDSNPTRAFRRLVEIMPAAWPGFVNMHRDPRAFLARMDERFPPEEPDEVDLATWRTLKRPAHEWRELAYRQAAQAVARSLRLPPGEWVLRAMLFTCLEAQDLVVECHGFALFAPDGRPVHTWLWWAERHAASARYGIIQPDGTYWADTAPEHEQDRLAYLLRAVAP